MLQPFTDIAFTVRNNCTVCKYIMLSCYNPVKYFSRCSLFHQIFRITSPDYNIVYQTIKNHDSIKQKLTNYYINFCKVPLAGLYVNQGLLNLLLLAICLYALCEKNGRLLLLGLPLLLTLAVTFVGPAALGHPRYTFPITYGMPLFFGLFLERNKLN